MNEIIRQFEQYCTNCGANVTLEEIATGELTPKIRCTNENCPTKKEGCKNKLLQNC